MEQEQKRNHTAKKTFREMSDSERARHSLSARIFRATLVGSIVFGVVGLVVGLGLYTRVLTERYISQAVDVTPSAYASVRHGVDSISIAKEVMEIYRGLSEEERMKTGTEEYRALFAHVVDIEGYDRLQNILLGFVNSSDVDDVYADVAVEHQLDLLIRGGVGLPLELGVIGSGTIYPSMGRAPSLYQRYTFGTLLTNRSEAAISTHFQIDGEGREGPGALALLLLPRVHIVTFCHHRIPL